MAKEYALGGTISDENISVNHNSYKNGVEIRFSSVPSSDVIAKVKARGFRYSSNQKLWYAKYTESLFNWAIQPQALSSNGESKIVVSNNAEFAQEVTLTPQALTNEQILAKQPQLQHLYDIVMNGASEFVKATPPTFIEIQTRIYTYDGILKCFLHTPIGRKRPDRYSYGDMYRLAVNQLLSYSIMMPIDTALMSTGERYSTINDLNSLVKKFPHLEKAEGYAEKVVTLQAIKDKSIAEFEMWNDWKKKNLKVGQMVWVLFNDKAEEWKLGKSFGQDLDESCTYGFGRLDPAVVSGIKNMSSWMTEVATFKICNVYLENPILNTSAKNVIELYGSPQMEVEQVQSEQALKDDYIGGLEASQRNWKDNTPIKEVFENAGQPYPSEPINSELNPIDSFVVQNPTRGSGIDRAIKSLAKNDDIETFNKNLEIVKDNPNYNTKEKFNREIDKQIYDYSEYVEKTKLEQLEWVKNGGDSMKENPKYKETENEIAGTLLLIDSANKLKDIAFNSDSENEPKVETVEEIKAVKEEEKGFTEYLANRTYKGLSFDQLLVLDIIRAYKSFARGKYYAELGIKDSAEIIEQLKRKKMLMGNGAIIPMISSRVKAIKEELGLSSLGTIFKSELPELKAKFQALVDSIKPKNEDAIVAKAFPEPKEEPKIHYRVFTVHKNDDGSDDFDNLTLDEAVSKYNEQILRDDVEIVEMESRTMNAFGNLASQATISRKIFRDEPKTVNTPTEFYMVNQNYFGTPKGSIGGVIRRGTAYTTLLNFGENQSGQKLTSPIDNMYLEKITVPVVKEAVGDGWHYILGASETTQGQEPITEKVIENAPEFVPAIAIAEPAIETPTDETPKEIVEKSKISLELHDYANRYEVNKAIERLIDEGHGDYSTDEKIFMTNYSGYGNLEKFGATGVGLKYEFYTPEKIVEKMWGLAVKHGYTNGDWLEPSVGSGRFIKKSPTPDKCWAFEINKYSALIAQILYPLANIIHAPFETQFIKDNSSIKGKVSELKKYDLIIGNPPYGDLQGKYFGMGEKDYTNASNFVEYFITRGLDLLNKDGLLIYIVGAELKNGGKLFLQGGKTKCKELIADKAILLDAYRLPAGLFDATGVETEIIVLKRK